MASGVEFSLFAPRDGRAGIYEVRRYLDNQRVHGAARSSTTYVQSGGIEVPCPMCGG